ncbi:type III polyketide synthase [Kocuria sp. WRN011]|uniref:Type III polyketide synthase n=1 Tax=Kocuria carniphila TaxID=262208 RepID=A0ABV3V8D8_9MICC|nr:MULTISPECIES: type III polyketide synthase [Kocuria]MCT1803874.1 type III polyketide synthase [Kocuria carniphila]PBB08787.1 type III polyketide synthase [Kocuria sp. WRN011]PZP35278.1 MAG: type III polyketide synthase [Kocuria rhizophila]
MTVRMLTIATAVPDTQIHQPDVAKLFANQPAMTRLGSRLVGSAFAGSGVATRHTVLPELGTAVSRGLDGTNETDDAAPSPFVDPVSGHLLSPGTQTRNQLYTEHARRLFVRVGRTALAQAAPAVEPEDVTHVITVSCTGFFAPGPDVRVVKDLGLPANVARTHLGFMGCNAAFPALRAAYTACRSDPQAVVLVVCVELCTLHLHVRNDPDTIMGNALFADGAAATVVTARDSGDPTVEPVLELEDFETTLAPVGEEDLAWSVGDEGFEMILGTYVPRIIDDHVTDALAPLLSRAELDAAEIPLWAVHPGGRSILDKVQSRLGLTHEQMEPSRGVLSEVGNMSSATILFVLDRIRTSGARGLVAALAFGPGLSIESALVRAVEPEVRPR